MSVLVAVVLVVGGLALSIWASSVVVERAAVIVASFGVPPFLIGMVLFALGTDLPEIANSVAASVSGHGDLNVGDSIGSALVQSTVVLGVLAFVRRGPVAVERREIAGTGIVTVAALGAAAWSVSDGMLDRVDGLVLIALWVAGSAVVWRVAPPSQLDLPVDAEPARALDVLVAAGGLALVGGGALAAVQGLVGLADALGISEFVVSFFLASVGTSLPELVVNTVAIRRGETALAVGGVVGASMLDASVSIGSGPLVAPVAVTAATGVRSALVVLVVIAAVTVLLAARRRHDAFSAVVCLLLYVAAAAVGVGVG